MSDGPVIRPFEEPDLPEVLEVLRLSLGEPPGLTRTPALFAWKHFDNPFGRSLMWVAEEGGQLTGFRAFMRWQLTTPTGYSLRCVRAVDTATHPAYQRRGLFRRLTLAGVEGAIADGVDLIFNTPNRASGAGYLTMGWTRIGSIGVMVRPGFGLWQLARRGRSWELPARTDLSGTLDGLTAAAFDQRRPAGLRTPRSGAYLRWRFGSHPTAEYRLAGDATGVAIGRTHLRNGRRELVISEMIGERSPRAVSTLRATVRPDYTVAWFSPGAVERRLALRGGLVPVPGLAPLTLMARPLRDLPFDLGPASWDLSLGDLELL